MNLVLLCARSPVAVVPEFAVIDLLVLEVLEVVGEVSVWMVVLVCSPFLLIGWREVDLVDLIILYLYESVQILLQLIVHGFQLGVIEVEYCFLPAVYDMVEQLLGDHCILEPRAVQWNEILLVLRHERGEVLEVATLLLGNVLGSGILLLLFCVEAEAT